MFTLHPQAKAYCPREKKISGFFKKAGHDGEKVIQKKFPWNFLNGSKEILAGKRKTLSTESSQA